MIILSLLGLLLAFVEFNKIQHVCRHESPHRSCTVTGSLYGVIRAENETYGLYEFSLLIVKGPDRGGCSFPIHAMGNGKSDTEFIRHLLCFVQRVHRTGNNLDLFGVIGT